MPAPSKMPKQALPEPPWPHVAEPTRRHLYTVVLLHGLGSNGQSFGKELLETGKSSRGGLTLAELLPDARWVFPTSRRRRSSAFGRAVLAQWFDIANLQDPSHRSELQLRGLAESAQDILAVLRSELARVAPERLILGGLSQGCAMSLAVLLGLEHPISGFIGMSGFLTFQADLELAVAGTDSDGDELGKDDDDPFERDDDDDAGGGGGGGGGQDVAGVAGEEPVVRAQVLERGLLGLDVLDRRSKETTAHSTPIFLGHGGEDEKIPCSLGTRMAAVLKEAQYDVVWRRYQGLGHWYRIPDEIDDIVDFIRVQVGWDFDVDGSSDI